MSSVPLARQPELQPLRVRPVRAAWGSHAPGPHRQGTTRRRPWGDGGAARSTIGGSKARPQARTEYETGARRREKATALTAGRRCRRRRLGVGGGAASVFTAAPALVRFPRGLRAAPPSSGSSRSRPASAATRRRRRGVGLPPPRLLFLNSPPSSSPTAARLWKGAKPQCGLVARPTAPCLPPLAFESPAPQDMAKSQRCPCWVCPSARGGAARFLFAQPRSQGHGAGVIGSFPPPAPLDSRARARALGVRAGWATRPCPAPRAGVARPAAR
jgi:hypothetical protein